MPLVVKVGGSLYDWPELGPRLARWLEDNDTTETTIVPGGGHFAESVRRLQTVHGLSDESAHWLALRAMSLAAEFLRKIIRRSEYEVADAFHFCTKDDAQPGALPHSWSATSDSVAARLAELRGAEIVLLKSVDPPPGNVAAWAEAGYVDRHFPEIVARAKLSVRAINLRAY